MEYLSNSEIQNATLFYKTRNEKNMLSVGTFTHSIRLWI